MSSVLAEITITTAVDHERRGRRRVRFEHPEPVKVGRLDGILLDVSASGAKVRHMGSVKLGSEVRLSFGFGFVQVLVVAHVLASRVVNVGHGGATVYESRFRFSHESAEVDRLIEGTLEH